jgi:hypothetical protein
MPAFICTTCGVQHPVSEAPPARCIICEDDRQYVNARGQTWTTMASLRQTHFNAFRRHEAGLMGVGTMPAFAIGQRALLVRTPQGNILWDCISFIDDATVAIITALGGVSAIAASHPHFHAAMVEWSHALGGPTIHLHASDRRFVTRLDSVISFWEDESLELSPGITLIRCGGHFPGSTVLHWAQGAGGHGALMTGDTIQVTPDRNASFMRSYPNLVPLNADTVLRITDILEPWPFEAIYGGWWDRIIPSDAKAVLSRSAQRYVAAIAGEEGAETY